MNEESYGPTKSIASPDNAPRLSREDVIARFLISLGLVDQALLAKIKEQPPADQLSSLLGQLVGRGTLSADQRRAIENFSDVVLQDRETSAGSINDTLAIAKELTPIDETLAHSPRQFRQVEQSAAGTFGEYEILGEIAKGGMGVIYKARQTKLNRIVAVKMIRTGEFAGEHEVKRFYAEAEAAARLDHPGIVSVYDVGETSGQHYFSMAFVDGESLFARVKREGPLTPKDAARFIRDTARAVQHAHQSNIVHRDIKPQNILLDKQGKVQVTDFGLAKLLQSASELTADGQILGTPAYMSPEQAAGRMEDVGVPADVYSLGATMYFLLTDRAPFQAATVHDTLRQVLDNEPLPPRKLNPSIPRDLETICLKCLRKDINGRYGSADELAADLERWLNNEPIVARRVNKVERAWKWCKRKPVVAGLSVAILLFAIIGGFLFWEQQQSSFAAGLVDSLVAADPRQVPRILTDLKDYEPWSNPRLTEILNDTGEGLAAQRARLHARLALADGDSSLADAIFADLLAAEVSDISNIRDALGRMNVDAVDRLWGIAHDTVPEPQARWRATLALCGLAPASDQWTQDDFSFLVEQLVATNPAYQPELWRLQADVGPELVGPAEAVFLDKSRSEGQLAAAANAICNFAPEDANRFARLIQRANPTQFKILFEKYQKVANSDSNGTLQALVEKGPSDELSDDQRISLGQQRAAAAITLLRLGERELIFDVLRFEDDPEALTQFVALCRDRDVTPQELLDCFEIAQLHDAESADGQPGSDKVMIALLLALGEYEVSDLSTPQAPLIARLADIYAQNPSSGVHGAAGWLLRRWGHAEEVDLVDQTALAYDTTGRRQWFVNKFNYQAGGIAGFFATDESFYMTFVVFPPAQFTMGSPDDQLNNREQQHEVTLTRPFAICDRELTWEQWMAMEGDGRRTSYAIQFSRTLRERDPVFGISWPEAMDYCSWLGERVEMAAGGKGEEDPPESADAGISFRLPTEAEWEYACRSGTSTPYAFGSDASLLGRYAWFQENSEQWSHAAGDRRPNYRGLYDMHGNLTEWCFDWYGLYSSESIDPTGPESGSDRVTRGGSWSQLDKLCQSGARYWSPPPIKGLNSGYRVAVALPPSEHGEPQ